MFEKQKQMVTTYHIVAVLYNANHTAPCDATGRKQNTSKKLNFLYNTHRLSLDTKVTNISEKVCSKDRILYLNLEKKYI